MIGFQCLGSSYRVKKLTSALMSRGDFMNAHTVKWVFASSNVRLPFPL